jgi:transcription antitermination protein NusB
MKDRSRARGWALQTLYAWETRGMVEPPARVLRQLQSERRIAEASLPYAQQLLNALGDNVQQVDRTVQGALSNWRLERLSVIDRNILRLATAEMLFLDEVPPRVSIQEAILLAEKYGTADSPRFVNGVLDALMRSLNGDVKRERS